MSPAADEAAFSSESARVEEAKVSRRTRSDRSHPPKRPPIGVAGDLIVPNEILSWELDLLGPVLVGLVGLANEHGSDHGKGNHHEGEQTTQ